MLACGHETPRRVTSGESAPCHWHASQCNAGNNAGTATPSALNRQPPSRAELPDMTTSENMEMPVRPKTRLTAGGLLLGALLTNFAPTLVAPVAAADPMAQSDLSDHLPLLGDINEIDNPNQIERPDELAGAQDSPHSLSADGLSRELSNPNSPLASLTLKQTHTSFSSLAQPSATASAT